MRVFRCIFLIALCFIILSWITFDADTSAYQDLYASRLTEFQKQQGALLQQIDNVQNISGNNAVLLLYDISELRSTLKEMDFWLRYLEPVAYKKINGPLPVEWETEVFEKFEKPYKREGAGLSLAEIFLTDGGTDKDDVYSLIERSQSALAVFQSDSILNILETPDHFFFANRLYLLNLTAIYTTGFECPDPDNIINELQHMIIGVEGIYNAFNKSFPDKSISQAYFSLYTEMESFVAAQSRDPQLFDHYHFIRDYVNPLFTLNQHFINDYHLVSHSFNDYSLNDENYSIFSKDLYKGQNAKGIYLAVNDPHELERIRDIGKLLFFDPILSGNGKRSCASCHQPAEYFSDTSLAVNFMFNKTNNLKRNTPSLVNVVYNHLLMLDGKHISLQDQAKDVISNPNEMALDPQKVLENVLSCTQYKKAFAHFAKLTPNYPEVSIDHIVSAITLYYTSFSGCNSAFDNAMNNAAEISDESIRGFNLFMSKAQCATCHFIPQFNGVKPPYVSSEFEVLGIPADTSFTSLDADSGRYTINPAVETLDAFRTGTLRNSSFTKPYMHNGVFLTMNEVIDFYNNGGGVGRGLTVINQTLSSDSLHLSVQEIEDLKSFIKTLDEPIPPEQTPEKLPSTHIQFYKNRRPGGEY